MMKIENFGQLNEYLKQFVPGSIADGDFYNPQKMFELLPLVGDPHKQFKVVHVAGTSGKTSTCYYIAEMLQASGAKVGLTVSPHIFEINERIQVNGRPISEQELCKLFNEFITTSKLTELDPTYFELLITFAFWVFVKKGCSHAVVEVGLGGLKDGTNVFDDPSKVSVITDIGLDHTRILGDTIEKIATQKAGIIKKGNHVFCYEQDDVVDAVIDEHVQDNQAILHRLSQPTLDHKTNFVKDLPEYQKRNWLLAHEVVQYVVTRDELAKLDESMLEESQAITIPARMQRLSINNKLVILDGAHNPQKLDTLIRSLKMIYPQKSFALLVAFMESKQTTLSDSLKLLHGLSNNIVVTEFLASTDLPHKVIPAHELAVECRQKGFAKVVQSNNAEEGFDKLLQQHEDVLLITGSFYLIGTLYQKLKGYL